MDERPSCDGCLCHASPNAAGELRVVPASFRTGATGEIAENAPAGRARQATARVMSADLRGDGREHCLKCRSGLMHSPQYVLLDDVYVRAQFLHLYHRP